MGVRRDEWYGELHLQPEFHSLLDPDQGYLPGAQIKFLDTALCYSPAAERLWLKTLRLLDIVSIAPRDRFFQPYSWKVAAGWDTEAMADGKDSPIFRVNTGGGLARRAPWGGIMHVFAELDLNAGKRLPGTVALGPGISVGTLEQVTDWWKTQLLGEAFLYLAGDDRISLEAVLAQSFRLARNSSLSLELSYGSVRGHGVPEGTLLLNHYF